MMGATVFAVRLRRRPEELRQCTAKRRHRYPWRRDTFSPGIPGPPCDAIVPTPGTRRLLSPSSPPCKRLRNEEEKKLRECGAPGAVPADRSAPALRVGILALLDRR